MRGDGHMYWPLVKVYVKDMLELVEVVWLTVLFCIVVAFGHV